MPKMELRRDGSGHTEKYGVSRMQTCFTTTNWSPSDPAPTMAAVIDGTAAGGNVQEAGPPRVRIAPPVCSLNRR
jgi:hypothetical protein